MYETKILYKFPFTENLNLNLFGLSKISKRRIRINI